MNEENWVHVCFLTTFPLIKEGTEDYRSSEDTATSTHMTRTDPSNHRVFSLTWPAPMHPRRPRGSQLGRFKRHDESFQAWAEEPLGTDSHRTISKRSSECLLLIGHKKCFVLLCPIGEQFLLSSVREFVHDGYYLATVARFLNQAFLTRNEGAADESKNVSNAISRSNSICTEKILFLTDLIVSEIMGSLRPCLHGVGDPGLVG